MFITHLSVQGLPVDGALLKMKLYHPCSAKNSTFADAIPALPTYSNKYTEYTAYYNWS
jgi:hypothetical protein